MLIVIALLFWIGIQLDAPDWYAWLLAILVVWKLLFENIEITMDNGGEEHD